jgi:16S rRNA processing protein RimM
VAGGEAQEWTGIDRVWIGRDRGEGSYYRVEGSRAYRDRLVLKLEGIEDGNAAAGLRGLRVCAQPADAPSAPEGRYYRAQLIGLRAVDEAGEELGRVEDLVPTAGHDLLVLSDGLEGEHESDEVLVPFVPEIVREVDLEQEQIVLRLPEGLRNLNRS